jgi:hypothetical protein
MPDMLMGFTSQSFAPDLELKTLSDFLGFHAVHFLTINCILKEYSRLERNSRFEALIFKSRGILMKGIKSH